MALVYGSQDYSTSNTLEAALSFMVDQIMSRMSVCKPVKVVAVHTNGRSGVVGTVDVTILTNQQTVIGESIPHTIIYGVPFIRIAGGAAALILDPKIGDTGFCVFADRDISSFKQTGVAGVPPTFRQYDMSDGIYIGGWNLNVPPQQWIVIDDDGIDINAGTGTLSEEAQTRTSDIVDSWTQNAQSIETNVVDIWQMTASAFDLVADTFDITVPEFHIHGNLSVDGIVHCTWEGNSVGVGFGGTGADLSATGGPNMVVVQQTEGASFTVVPIGDLDVTVEYSNPVPTPATLGGIAAGSTFTDQTMQEMWTSLLYPYQVPVFTSFYIVGQASPLEVGQSIVADPSFTWSTINPSNITPNTIIISDVTASTVIASGVADTPPEATTYGTVTKVSATSEVFEIVATDTKNNSFTDNYTVDWLWRVYWGDSASTSLLSGDVVALTSSQLQSGFAGDYAFSAASGEYKIFCYPASMGTATSFIDAGTGFAVPFNAPYNVNVTNAYGVTTSYNVHQSTYQLGGALTLEVS